LPLSCHASADSITVLSSSLFQAPSLEATIYAKKNKRLFFFDSAGLWINECDGVGPRVNAKTLRALLPDGHDNSISFMSVKSTDLGPLALRSRCLPARLLDRSGVFMGEHLNVVTRASGYIHPKAAEDGIRRAVGFSRSRIRDGKGNDLTAQQYADWCGTIDAQLDAASQTASIFTRFAVPDTIPADTTPLNILVDIVEMGISSSPRGRPRQLESRICVSRSKRTPTPRRRRRSASSCMSMERSIRSGSIGTPRRKHIGWCRLVLTGSRPRTIRRSR
jgi:hypothetical protein